MKPNENENETVQFTMRLDRQVHKKIVERAKQNKRSLTKEIEFVLEKELENDNK